MRDLETRVVTLRRIQQGVGSQQQATNVKDYVHHKQVKLMSKGNRDMIEPLTEIYDMLNLQDLHFKVLEHETDTGRKATK